MFRWPKPGSTRPATARVMAGPRAADAVLFLGAAEPAVAAEIGTVTRLNGRTVVVAERTDAQAPVERAAEQAGALLEFVAAPLDALPFDSGTFQIVVTAELADWPAERRATRLAEAVRVLEPGGRIIILVVEAGTGLLGSLGRKPPLEKDAVIALLTRSGVLAARKLADSDHVAYYEARKARP